MTLCLQHSGRLLLELSSMLQAPQGIPLNTDGKQLLAPAATKRAGRAMPITCLALTVVHPKDDKVPGMIHPADSSDARFHGWHNVSSKASDTCDVTLMRLLQHRDLARSSFKDRALHIWRAGEQT